MLNIDKSKQEDTDVLSLNMKIKTLQNEKQTLEFKIKQEISNTALIKVQHEDQLRHENNILEETRLELKNMITTSKNEDEFLNASLQSKNEEINKLNETIGELSVKIQEIQEENIALRSQMSSQFQDSMTVKTDSSKNTNTVTKPKVLLLGTSNTKGINEDKLSSSVETQKTEAFTLDQARNHITTSDLNPNVVVLHILTNDLKTKPPQACVQKMQELVELIFQKWEYISCIISLTTPRQEGLKNRS
jgi:chromosome segregation ATPase